VEWGALQVGTGRRLQAAKETVGSGILGVLPAPPLFYSKLIPSVIAMLRSTKKHTMLIP
jgi:hypothetical protein